MIMESEGRTSGAPVANPPPAAQRARQVEVPCNLCGADDCAVLFDAGVAQVNRIVRCRRCGLMYANPRRPADHVAIASWPDDPDWDFVREHPQRFEKEQLQVRDYAQTRALLGRLHPGRGTLVEVGSSLGFILDFFRADGWDVLGVEPDRNATRHAERRLGLRALTSTLEEARLPGALADAVVMLHVIEHVPDPLGTLREIHRVLKPGGHLVLETPRYDTLAFRALGRRERSLSCDGHIFFFTSETLRRSCERAGFELVHRELPGRSLTLDRLLYNVGVVSKSPALQRTMSSVSRRAALNRVRLRVNLRDIQRLCLVKPA